VDRSLLRLAVWELAGGQTPPKVVLDEAIEMAKSFSTEHSPSFINGVLDAVLKEREKTAATDASVETEPPAIDAPDVSEGDVTMPDITTS
jgi:N utilization substance protein B